MRIIFNQLAERRSVSIAGETTLGPSPYVDKRYFLSTQSYNWMCMR
jgi:hypothetical protein